ncbi:extracellular solute-binding protein [Streptomyces sp. NBC_01280]|uniref:ABC transporter substrate-binding protein n=1 Tax=unclassified Streptomyces TaxID=2593676 RepID=UPI002E37A7FC|nr:extracellular solute-binding protein [Streptomyces sp. NBC_01280]WSE13056.1 extracellular solute-binding protein [Streptomyces sp. NBC_01397]
MKRNPILTRTVALAGALLLAGCTAGSSGTSASKGNGDKVTLTFLTFETPNLDAKYWDAAIARASAEVPGVTIKKLVSPSADRTGYAKQLDSTGQFPDVMIGLNPAGFAEAGKLAPWTEKELATYKNPRANTYDGKVYQLPYAAQTTLVYYNKKEFAAAGIDTPPHTYAELLDDTAKLKKKGINPFVVGGGGKDSWADMFPLICTVATDVYKKTPDWLSQRAKGKVKFTDPAFVTAAQKVAGLADKGYIERAGLSRSYADTEQAFRDGKGAMYPMGSWFSASADTKKPDFDTGVFAWPTDQGAPALPGVLGGGMTVSSKASDVPLAKKWAKAFMEDHKNLDAAVKADGLIIDIKGYSPPGTMGPVYKETLAAYQQAQKDDGIVNSFSQETGDGSLPPGLADKAAIGVQKLIGGRMTAKEFGAYMDEQWDKATR